MIDRFQHQIVQVETVISKIFEEERCAMERFSNLTKKSAVLAVEKRAAMRCRFAHKQSGDTGRPIAVAHIFQVTH